MMRFLARGGYLRDPSVSPDVIHDAFLRVLAGEVELPTDQRKAWGTLLATIRNVARNHARYESLRYARPLESLSASVLAERWDERESGWRIRERVERAETVNAALACLSPARREVVRLRYLEDRTIAEIAWRRSCSTQTVRNLLTRALAQLRAELDGRFGAG